MTIMELAAQLGKTIKADPIILRLNAATEAYENNSELVSLLSKYGAFNQQLKTMREASEIDEASAKAVEDALDSVYDQIMEHPAMAEYNDAKADADALMAAVSEEISFQITGKHSCGHDSCDGCSGCH